MTDIFDILLDTLIDALKLLPFLFLAYLIIELLEHKAGEHTLEVIHRSGRWGPVLGGLLGIVPQCGFSAATANLYAGGVITRGTLLAVFLSTSDEMLPVFLTEQVEFSLIVKLLMIKAAVGILVGLLIDCAARLTHRSSAAATPHDLCEHSGCHCEEHSPLYSALHHTLHIFIFLLLVTLVLNLIVAGVGEERLAEFVWNRPVIGELLAGVIGLIPNCAASVVLTELYLQGGMGLGALMAGLLVGAGVGILVLFRMNRNWKDNLLTVGLLYIFGVGFGLLIGLLPIV